MPAPYSLQLFSASLPISLWLPLAALAGVGLDRLLGEPKHGHPLVGFGKLANALERILNRGAWRRAGGLLAWLLIVPPFVAVSWWATPHNVLGWAVDAFLLYLALGGRSLAEHAVRVASDLAAGDLAAARQHVGWLVSRETSGLDESGVAKACVESTLENGNDAVFGTLFWFALFGGPGAVLFRLANTLDAMWGYKTARFIDFGWAAARIDDLLNYLPARLTALSYALFGKTRSALVCWRTQAPFWESPNAGPVMASGAASLGLLLGGSAIYHGQLEERPVLGAGRPAQGADIARVLQLVRCSLLLWLGIFFCWGVLRA